MKPPETGNNLVCISFTNIDGPAWQNSMTEAAYRTLGLLGISNWELSINFCDDSFIRELNAGYRHKDSPTDVLSFSQSEQADDFFPGNIDPEGRVIAGDIVISVDTASRNAARDNIMPEAEIRRLIVHGILHLYGMDHDENNEDMLILQEKLLNQIREGGI